MKVRRSLKVAVLIVLAILGVLMYANLQSVHQTYRVTKHMVNSADSVHQGADKEGKDREEQRHELLAELTIAATLLEDAAAAVSRALRSEIVPQSQRVRDLPFLSPLSRSKQTTYKIFDLRLTYAYFVV